MHLKNLLMLLIDAKQKWWIVMNNAYGLNMPKFLKATFYR